MLCGPNELFKGTFVATLYWFLTEGALEYLEKLYQKIFGKKFNYDNKIFKIVFSEKHHFIQMFYLVVSLGGIILFFKAALLRIPNENLGSIHFILMPLAIMFIYISFYIASTSNPGIITENNVDKICKHFKYDHVLYSERLCRTCNMIKPARSKHCGLCNACVAKADHHCSWINNCVGYLNFRWFLLFLFSNLVICVYGIYLSYNIIKFEAKKIGLDTGIVFNKETRRYERLSRTKIVFIMITRESILSGLIFFLGASLLVVLGFLLYQFYITGVDGMTSNEFSKWERLEDSLLNGHSIITKTYVGDEEQENIDSKVNTNTNIDEEDVSTSKKKETSTKNNNLKNRKKNKKENNNNNKNKNKNNQNSNATEKESLLEDDFYEGMIKNGYKYTKITEFNSIKNQYDYGVKENIKEIFFPDMSIF